MSVCCGRVERVDIIGWKKSLGFGSKRVAGQAIGESGLVRYDRVAGAATAEVDFATILPAKPLICSLAQAVVASPCPLHVRLRPHFRALAVD